MDSVTHGNRSQAWFRPGTYVPVVHRPVSQIRGLEVLSTSRGSVQVAKGTIHGTAAELRDLAYQMLRAAEQVDPTPATRRAGTARGLRAA